MSENVTPSVKKSLYLKYRPQNFDSLVGQDHIRNILKASASSGNLAQGYLLIGPRGTGKTTTARLIAKTLNCLNPKNSMPCEECDACINIQNGHFMDVIEIDAASNTGVDDMRDLIEKAQFAPSIGKKKVYIIDEVHMLSKSAFNALLKTLEEPPSHVHFILATTESNKVPPTIISRCQRFDFNRISADIIVSRLKHICDNEKFTFEEKALEIIANNADGGLRDAISLIEQVVLDKKITVENIEFSLGIVKGKFIEEFVNLLLERKTNLALKLVNQLYSEGINLSQFKKETLEFLRQKILTSIDEKNESNKLDHYLKLTEALNDTDIDNATIPQFPIELMICKLTLSRDEQVKVETPIETQVPSEPKTPSKENIEVVEKKNDTPKTDKPKESIQKEDVQTDKEEYRFTPEDLPDKKFTVKPTLDKIKEDWMKINKKIKTPTEKLSFKDAFLEKFENDILSISLTSEFHYNKVRSNLATGELSDVLSEHFKTPITVTVSLSKIKVDRGLVEETPEYEPQVEDIIPPTEKEVKKKSPESGDDSLNIDKVHDLFSS